MLARDAVDLALDGEEGVDAFDCLDRNGRLGDPRKIEELAPCMGPACGFNNGSRFAALLVEPVKAGIGVGLHQACIARQMLLRVDARTIARVEEQRGRRIGSAKRPVVANISP